MKKILMLSLASSLVLFSCSGEDKGDEKKGPSLCDCVNQTEMTDECKKMQEEWKEKFQNANEEEQEAMMKEIQACQENK